MVKRKSPIPPQELDRIATNVWSRGDGKISNETDFNAVFEGYLGDQPQLQSYKKDIFSKIRKRHSKVKDSRGRNKSRREFFKQVGKVPRRTKAEGQRFTVVAWKGKRQVWASQTRVRYKVGKGRKVVRERTVLRDVKGRFVRKDK